MRTKLFGTALALVACAMLAPAHAGDYGGHGGHGSHGGHGGFHLSNNNSSWSGSKSYSSSSASNTFNFKSGTDWNGIANAGVGALGILFPAPGPVFNVRGGNTYVSVVIGGMPGMALPDLKGPGVITSQPPYGGTDHRPICEDGQPYKPNCRVR